MTHTFLNHAVRRWAKGILPFEAGVELLIRQGKAIYDGAPWVKTLGPAGERGGVADLDLNLLLEESKGWSGGERRVTAIASSLLGGERVDLSDAITGLDRRNVSLVLAALAHANGSHQDSEIRVVDSELSRIVALPSAYAWPGEERAAERSRRSTRTTQQGFSSMTQSVSVPAS